jgi:MFS family permease
MSMVLFIASWQAPLQVGIVRDVLAPTGDHALRAEILGAMTAAWGVGMVLGSVLMPFIARRIAPGRLLALAIGLAGLAFMFASWPRTIVGVVAAWAVVGLASGLANVSYETLLQSSTPSGFLGRTFATVEAAQDAAFFLGALAVGALAWIIDPTMGLVAAGAAFLVIALIGGRLMDPRTAREPDAITTPMRERDAADLA